MQGGRALTQGRYHAITFNCVRYAVCSFDGERRIDLARRAASGALAGPLRAERILAALKNSKIFPPGASVVFARATRSLSGRKEEFHGDRHNRTRADG